MQTEHAERETQNTIIQDGFIIDADTGEVVGLEKGEFHVTDEASADWVLEKMMDAQANAARVQIKRKALLENLDEQERHYKRTYDFLNYRFGRELAEFARRRLEETKAKTKVVKLSFGRLSFRTVRGGLRVADPEKAIQEGRG